MMIPIDKDRLHLWMGLTHPLFGPLNLMTYSTVVGYSCYVAWIEALINATQPPERPGNK